MPTTWTCLCRLTRASTGVWVTLFDFSDYAPVELAEILNSIVRGAGFKLAPSLSANSFQRLSNVIEAKTLEEAREMMNGGLCERLFDFAKQSLDAREAVVSATNPPLEITEGDILEACRRIPPPPVREGRRGDSREAGDQSNAAPTDRSPAPNSEIRGAAFARPAASS